MGRITKNRRIINTRAVKIIKEIWNKNKIRTCRISQNNNKLSYRLKKDSLI